MNKSTVVLPFSSQPGFDKALQPLIQSPFIEKVIVLGDSAFKPSWPKCEGMRATSINSGKVLNKIVKKIKTDYLLIITHVEEIQITEGSLEYFIDTAESTAAGMVYSDYLEGKDKEIIKHPLNDYQPGSIRDGFDFGDLILFSVPAVNDALRKYGAIPEVEYAGLYALRLKVSIDHKIVHIRDFLYTRLATDGKIDEKEPLREKLFDYVHPLNQTVQKEMEKVATQHLKNIGAYLGPKFNKVPAPEHKFPVEASVVIPVLNRARTISNAIQSALSQETDFHFNVIVVDNHSTNGTTAILADMAKRYPTVKHIIPARVDLSIGGCWNEAVFSEFCGRYAVQLDSDDLYSSTETLQKIINVFRKGDFAMVIGSYTLVNERLEEIPPGLIDHREWTDKNGRNNALRINGLGAPRAFETDLLRKIGFLNVGYGEDYAMALRLSRQYQIGRIYESIYLCRRWGGNTDAFLSIEQSNRNDAFKDEIRTLEIRARQEMTAK
ncbi:MAG TPA: glycosyltransferase family A protein [Syntrophales bacterium]|nr:glycosyltransferase family A protein [Syntrophales bacterium]